MAESTVIINVSKDGLTAELTLHKPGGNESMPSKAGVQEALNAAGVKTGIDWDAIETMIETHQFDTPKICAQGTTPIEAHEGKFTFKFPVDEKSIINEDEASDKSEESDSSVVDLRQISKFYNFYPGDVLAVRGEPFPGRPGTTVRGEMTNPPKAKPFVLTPGKGTEWQIEDKVLIAKVAGHATYTRGKISIQDTLQISTDIDYSVGSLDFAGNIAVGQNVLAGFKVKCGGNLTINGNVEAADLDVGGELKVSGFVFGRKDCIIKCKGNSYFRGIADADLELYGSLTVEQYIRHCNILCAGVVEVKHEKGMIVGGKVAAAIMIIATNLGSSTGTTTHITVGTDPFAAIEVDNLDKEKDKLKKQLEQASAGINTIVTRTHGQTMQKALEDMYLKLLATQKAIEKRIGEIDLRLQELVKNRIGLKGVVKVKNVCYSGVILEIDGLLHRMSSDMAACSFSVHNSEVKVSPF